MLTRDQILSGPKPEVVDVEVPAYGGAVKVKQLSIAERDRFEIENAKAGGKNFRARLVVLTAVDDAGRPIFSAADVPTLSALAGHVLEPIVEAAVKTNRLSNEDVRDLEKN